MFTNFEVEYPGLADEFDVEIPSWSMPSGAPFVPGQAVAFARLGRDLLKLKG